MSPAIVSLRRTLSMALASSLLPILRRSFFFILYFLSVDSSVHINKRLSEPLVVDRRRAVRASPAPVSAVETLRVRSIGGRELWGWFVAQYAVQVAQRLPVQDHASGLPLLHLSSFLVRLHWRASILSRRHCTRCTNDAASLSPLTLPRRLCHTPARPSDTPRCCRGEGRGR